MRNLCILLVLAACGGGTRTSAPADTTDPGTAGAEQAPPSLRLPGGVVPTGYQVELALDPARTDFTGRVEIAVRIEQPTSLVWLNGHQLQIDRARLTTAGGDEVALEVLPQAESFIGFRAAAPLPAGPATIAIDYRGKVDAVDTYGIFHQQDRGRWYLYTQFESTAARRAFPCFDEPSYKVPWKLTLEVPADQVALANTPVASEATTDRGTRRVTFEETPPMPSYLVAFAVGPFELVDAGTTRGGVPIRIVATQGRGAETAWAVRSTARLVGLLEDYFGTPYPYAKLDSIAIPMTVNFGAMENPGLITYSERLLLTRPEDTTVATQRYYAWVAAHELAHQWFGNLVTPAWWNDIWLNEAFATWMERDVMREFEPAWDAAAASARDMSDAMWSDSLDSARQINQPIVTDDDIDSAFDSITYEKGAAVIRMFEHWVGPDTFRAGVRAYLKQHAWKNATSSEFLEAIGAAAGKDVKTPFSTFLDQVGTPLVSFDLRCDKGAPPVLALTQRRYLPIGSKAAANQTWQVPVCVEYSATGKRAARTCMLLTQASGELPLEYCPAWVAPNADAIGYYRSKLGGDLLPALLRSGFGTLSLAEKINVVADVRAMVASGDSMPAVQLDLARNVGGDKSRFLVAGAAGIITGVEDDVPAELDARYAAFVSEVFGKRARALGWTPKRGESLDAGEIRQTIVPLVADEGRDRALAAEALRLARAWLSDRSVVSPRMRDSVLRVAARNGDAALFEAFWAEAIATDSQRDRRALLTALGSFRDPALTSRALAAVLGDDLDIREALILLWTPLEDRHRRQLVFDFVEQHFDTLVAKMPGEASARLARVAAPQCDPAMRDRVEALLARVAKLPSGPRAAAQSLERFELCIDRRTVLAPALASYFRAR